MASLARGVRPAQYPPCYPSPQMGALAVLRSAVRGMASLRGAAAALVLLSIVTDIGADSRCHGMSVAHIEPSQGVSTSGSPAREDPCGDGCVPDCYCCSVLTLAPVFRLVQMNAPVLAGATAPEGSCAAGVQTPPYHPPLSRT